MGRATKKRTSSKNRPINVADSETTRAEQHKYLGTPVEDLPRVKTPDFSAKRNKEREDLICATLEKGYSLGFASEKASIHYRTLKSWRKDDPEFNARVEEAIERGTDVFEDEARRRAVEGVDEPVFQGGDLVGHKRVYSDALMQMTLGGRRAKYGKRNVELSGPNGAPAVIHHKIEVEFVEAREPDDK